MNDSQLLALETLVDHRQSEQRVRGLVALSELVRLRVAQASEQQAFASSQLAKVREAEGRDALDARSLPLHAVIKDQFKRVPA
jgi:tRNA U55 pseudouridine synthase TruB